jgi:hypothetical protein
MSDRAGGYMTQAALNTEKLDEHLLEVVRALQGAVRQGVSHSNDSKVIDNAIRDCKEILDVIMAGDLKEWLN